MILDKNAMFADGLAYGGTPTILDLADHGNMGAGAGEPIDCFFQATTALSGCTGFQVISEAADSTPEDVLMEITCTEAEQSAGIEFRLPSHLKRYVTIALVGTVTAGVFSSGVIIQPMQLAR